MRRTGVAILVACLLGISAGVGVFTFVYAKGYSYLSTDPLPPHRHLRGAESSMGFHAPQELARNLGETIDFARQLDAERAARKK